MVYPVNMHDLAHPSLVETFTAETCEEMKVHFVRPKGQTDGWAGCVWPKGLTDGWAGYV